MNVIFSAGLGEELRARWPERGSLAERQGVLHQLFREVTRPALRFKSDEQGLDPFGGSLSRIQTNNHLPPVGFDLLQDDLYVFLDEMEESPLFKDYLEVAENADSVFHEARQLLSRHQEEGMSGNHYGFKWSTPAVAAASTARLRSYAIFQREGRMGMAESAQCFWHEAMALTSGERLAMLAMSEVVAGLEIMRDGMRQFDDWTAEDGGHGDPDLTLKLRDEQSEWERDTFGYARSRFARADSLLQQGKTENERDRASALRAALIGEREARDREAPLVELGAKMNAGRSKGGASRKGEVLSVVAHAIRRLCEKKSSYEPKDILDEIRRDCVDDDEGVVGTSLSEHMNDLRECDADRVRVRFQEVSGDVSGRQGVIRFRNLDKCTEGEIKMAAFRNIISKAKPAELKTYMKKSRMS